MNLRSFRGRTLPEAMRQLRAELGADAIIVASRELASGEAQVTAAVEEEEEAGAEDDLAALLAPAQTAPVRAEIAAALAFHGVPATVRDALEAEVDRLLRPTDAGTVLAGALDRSMRFEPLGVPSGRAVALVGPPGSGKTAAVARLAASARLAGRAVGVRSTDAARAGGLEQLRAMLAPLGLSPEPWEAEADSDPDPADGRLLLVDTAGVNPFRGGEVTTLAAWLAGSGAEGVLVLPAGLDVHDAVEIVGVFATAGVRRCILTRLDAVRRLGAVVAVGATGVALAEAGVSPLIGKPLVPLSAFGLARLLLRRGGRGGG